MVEEPHVKICWKKNIMLLRQHLCPDWQYTISWEAWRTSQSQRNCDDGIPLSRSILDISATDRNFKVETTLSRLKYYRKWVGKSNSILNARRTPTTATTKRHGTTPSRWTIPCATYNSAMVVLRVSLVQGRRFQNDPPNKLGGMYDKRVHA